MSYISLDAQEYFMTNQFSRENSELGDNYIYDIAQDNNSFIWIATSNGAYRFDGNRFFRYSINNGLASNDVILFLKDQNGTLWADCFRQPPGYFEDKENEFKTLDIPGGDKLFNSFTNFFYDYNDRLVFWTTTKTPGQSIRIKNKNNVEIFNDAEFTGNQGLFYYIANPKIKTTDRDSLLNSGKNMFMYGSSAKKNMQTFYRKNRIYKYLEDGTLVTFSDFSFNPFHYEYKETKLSSPKWLKADNENINVVTKDNHFQQYDLNTLQLKTDIPVDEKAACGFLDRDGNLIIGTSGKGIIVYSKSNITKIDVPKEKTINDIVSLSKDSNIVYVGNRTGDILQIEDNNFTKIKVSNNLYVLKVLKSQKHAFILLHKGYSIDFNKQTDFFIPPSTLNNPKSAVFQDDETIIVSTIFGLYKVDLKTARFSMLNFPYSRLGTINRIDADNYYIISSLGLYLYNFKTNKYKLLFDNTGFSSAAYDGKYLFISTFKNEIYIFKDGKLVKINKNANRFSNDIQRIKYEDNKILIGTWSEIFSLTYKTDDSGNLKCTFTNILSNELPNYEFITDFVINGNYLYVSTEQEIYKMPMDSKNTTYHIPVQIINVNINGEKEAISDYYNLKPEQKSANISFTGVEISGHVKFFQYRVNGGKWENFNDNSLNVQLIGGTNTLEIKALDNNDNEGPVKKVVFDVELHYYENVLFWLLIGGAIFGGIIFAYSRWKFYKQEKDFETHLKLEEQRSKITADLHDDIGSTLSNLQINSSIANRLIAKNKLEDVSKILTNIEKQSRNLSERLGDIVWSLKPTKDAFMTLSTRIRNIANDILGSTNINYDLIIDEKIDNEISNFSARKNIILIIKEALNNAAKYSEATKLNLSFQKMYDEYILEINDNGIGFDPEVTKGNGIGNMKRRTEELHGKIEIISKSGILIIIHIPIIRE